MEFIIQLLTEHGLIVVFLNVFASQLGLPLPMVPLLIVMAARSVTDDVAVGGTITHHHAIGRDHARWLAAEDGETGIATLRAVKAELDPDGIMNPGKLFV